MVESIAAELQRNGSAPSSLALVCDVALQHACDKLAEALAGALALASSKEDRDVFVALPQEHNEPDFSGTSKRRIDWRFGVLTIDKWWAASLGTLSLAAAASPQPLRLCGRAVQRWQPPAEIQSASPSASSTAVPSCWNKSRELPSDCGLVLCASAAGSALEKRLILRHASSRASWRLDPETGAMERLSSHGLLLQRYRFVELAKAAGVVGLVLAATGSRHAQELADRLEDLLRRAGRRTYRFVVGRVTPEKLGNFPEVELFVSLASPEHFPWNSKEFITPIASPYELEVGLGAREWTGDYITDPEELLRAPMPAPGTGPDTMLDVQTLGGGSRIRQFRVEDASIRRTALTAPPPSAPDEMPAPALLTDGQHGVAQRYNTDVYLFQLRLKDGQVDDPDPIDVA